MQECQLQMEWGIYSQAIMAPAWLVNGLYCTARGVVVVGGDKVWCYHSTVPQIRSTDTSNGLDYWGYFRKGDRWIWRQGGWEDQKVSTNGTAGTITATVQACACVCVFFFDVSRMTLNLTGQSPQTSSKKTNNILSPSIQKELILNLKGFGGHFETQLFWCNLLIRFFFFPLIVNYYALRHRRRL